MEELAAATGVGVDTIRFYQGQGLIEPPERRGRVAWYAESHAQRLRRIRDLKEQGFTLAMVARVLAGDLDAGEEALAKAIVGPLPAEEAPESVPAGPLTLQQVSEHTGVSMTILEAVAREGILIPHAQEDAPYSAADVTAVKAGLALLEAGVPISELLALAREHDAAIGAVADQAVDLFARFVRDPIRARIDDEHEAAAQMVAALQTMLPAATEVVAHTFRRRLLQAARERIEADAAAAAATAAADDSTGAGERG